MDKLTKQKVEQLKDAGQDFEWYPTSTNMLNRIVSKIGSIHDDGFSVLDIGAGDGSVLEDLERLCNERTEARVSTKYAIEKSALLFAALPNDVVIVGTDFMEQTLIDKEVDTIFCNPPYSQYELWMMRIVKEANCKHIFMIVPDRWKDNKQIAEMLERRNIKTEVLESTDFLSGVDRQARAKVDVIYFDLSEKRRRNSFHGGFEDQICVDPYDMWFEEHFAKGDDDYRSGETRQYDVDQNKKEHIKNTLVPGKDMVPALVAMYRADMDKLLENYKLLCSLDADLLQTLGVTVKALKNGLKQKIEGMKTLYWTELFDNLQAITSRLATKTKEKLLSNLQGHVNVDFTETNIYAIVCWALKNANSYFDEQLLDIYQRLSKPENVIGYKSNHHFVKDTFRYCRGDDFWKDNKNYKLDYRIVHQGYLAIANEAKERYIYQHDYPGGLHKNAQELICDLFVVAKNLGFDIDTMAAWNRGWESNKAQCFSYVTINDLDQCHPDSFAEIKAFKNGNVHFKLNQKFMLALNVEASRLLGWIKSPKEASEQMGEREMAVEAVFKTNLRLLSIPNLLPETTETTEGGWL